MNKTFLRALPVFGILTLIITAVFIISNTNGDDNIPMVSNSNELIFESDNGNESVTKEELYNFLRYNKSINTQIDTIINNEILTNFHEDENGNKINYFELVRKDEDLNIEIKDIITQSIFGMTSEDESIVLNTKRYNLQITAQEYIDNLLLNDGINVDFDIRDYDSSTSKSSFDLINDLSDKVYEIESIYNLNAISSAKELFARKYLDEEVENDGFNDEDSPIFIESDELDTLAENLYENSMNSTTYAYGLNLSFDNLGDFKNAVSNVGTTTGIQIGLNDNASKFTDLANSGTELSTSDLSDSTIQTRIFNLYVALYDYNNLYIRHQGKFKLTSLFPISSTMPTVDEFKTEIMDEENLWTKTTSTSNLLEGKFPENAPQTIKDLYTGDDALEDNETITNYLISSKGVNSLSDYMFSSTSSLGTVNDTDDRDKLPFSNTSRSYNGDKNIVFLFDITESKEYDELSSDQKDSLLKTAKENYVDDALTSSYYNEKFNEAISESSLTIYDSLVKKTFSSDNPEYEINSSTSDNILVKIGDTEIKVDDIYSSMIDTTGYAESITILVQDKLILNFADGLLYENNFEGDNSSNYDDLYAQAENIKLSFGLDQATCTEFVEGYSWSEYLNLCYFVSDEAELVQKLASNQLSAEFNYINFSPDNYDGDADLSSYDSFSLNKNVINVDDAFIEDMENLASEQTLIFDNLSSVSANHLLVSLNKVDSEELADPTNYSVDNPSEWTTVQLEAAEKVTQWAGYTSTEDTILEDLNEFVNKFDSSPFGSTINDEVSLEDKCKTSDLFETNYKECFGYIKRLGLNLKVEELGSFNKGTMTTDFENRVTDLLQDPAIMSTLEDKDESGHLDTNFVMTQFGFHLINLTAIETIPSAELSDKELNDFNKGVGFLPEYKLDDDFVQISTDGKSLVPSKEQLNHYLELKRDEDLSIRLPENVQEAIDYYYTAVVNEKFSTNMIGNYVIQYFMLDNESLINDSDIDLFTTRIQLIKTQNENYRDLLTDLTK